MSRAPRLAQHSTVANRLALLSDLQLAALLARADPAGDGIGGTKACLDVDGVCVFVKQVPLTDLERRPEHVRSTANLFELPTFYQYGVGSAGFGAWRELAVHIMTTNWVLENQCPSFPILYHWRVLPQRARRSTRAEAAGQERMVAYWQGSAAVRARLAALRQSTASLVLFIEHIPQTVHSWLAARVALGGRAAASACALVERELQAVTSFMGTRGLLHFDAHFHNLLTDGRRLYFADFGLALSSRFDLSREESAFFRRHESYDRCYTATQLVHWLGSADLPAAAARRVNRHAPVALVMRDFLRRLQTSKTTPYPLAAIRRAQR